MIAGLKPYSAMKDSGVPWLGDVPEHWEVDRFKARVANIIEQTCERPCGGLYLALEHVESWTGRLRDAGPEVAFGSQVKRFRANDVLFGKLRPYLAKVARPIQGGVCVGEFFVLRPRGSGIQADYLAYWLRSKPIIDAINSSTFGAKMPRADWHFFGSMGLAFPLLLEQAAIVRFLDHADRRIRRYVSARQKLINLLEEQKQAIIHRAVTRGLEPNVRLKPSGVEWLGEVPEHWEVWKIGHFSRVGNGSTPSRGNSAYWRSGHYPWLNSAYANQENVTRADQFVTDTALRECHLPIVPPASVLVAITGQGKTRGKATVLRIEATINQHMAFITPNAEVASADYLRLALHGAYAQLRSISDDSGSTKGALTCADLKHFKLVLPPPSEQSVILAAVDGETRACSAAIDRAHRETSLLREYRTRLIADVVTGKLDVRAAAANLPDQADEPAAPDDSEALAEREEDADNNQLDATPEEV